MMSDGPSGSPKEKSPAVLLLQYAQGKGCELMAAEAIIEVARRVEVVGSQTRDYLEGMVAEYYGGEPMRMLSNFAYELDYHPLPAEVVIKEGFQNFLILISEIVWSWMGHATSPITSGDIVVLHWLYEKINEDIRSAVGPSICKAAMLAGEDESAKAYEKLLEAKRMTKETSRMLMPESERSVKIVEAEFRSLLEDPNLRHSPKWNLACDLRSELVRLVDADKSIEKDGETYAKQVWNDVRPFDSTERQ